MWRDDLKLVADAVAKYKPEPLYVEAGGLISPVIADYDVTIREMARLKPESFPNEEDRRVAVEYAQRARYLGNVRNPLAAFLPGYTPEDPSAGGCSIDGLAAKYGPTIGCLVCLSTLEHVEEPWYAPEQMHDAMKPGGLLIVSVPFEFPWHGSPPSFGDHWRFSPTGLDILFRSPTDGFEKLESGWRLDVRADEGVLDIHTMRPQAIKSAFWIGRAR